MYPRNFEYYRAKSVQDAIDYMDRFSEARIIAGGQSLMPMLKLRIASPEILVDIGRIPELTKISVEGDSVRIGAMVRHKEIVENKIIMEKIPILSATAEHIADIQIRNRGTIGGSICEADPSADYLPTLFILNAELRLQSKSGERKLKIEDFILGAFETSIEPGEILTEIIITSNRSNYRVEKYARRSADFAVASIAALCKLAKDGSVDELRVAVGAQDGIPLRFRQIEKDLKGVKPDREVIMESVSKAGELLSPIDDTHGSSEYRAYVTLRMMEKKLSELLLTGGE